MDPYEILNLPANGARSCTLEQVRFNYKQLARQLHPDKRPDTVSQEDATYMFQVLTDAYKRVVAEVERHRIERTHDELKRGAQDFFGGGGGVDPAAAAKFAGGGGGGDGGKKQRFNIAKFNKVFEDVRVSAAEDRGYGDWMNKNPASLRQAEEEERARIARQTALQKYRDPEPTPLPGRCARQMTFTELGSRRKDFGGVDFSDYRIAHTTTRLADEQARQQAEANRVSYEALKRERESATFEMTAADLRAEELRRSEQARLEERRRRTLERQDEVMTRQYERANRLLLN